MTTKHVMVATDNPMDLRAGDLVVYTEANDIVVQRRLNRSFDKEDSRLYLGSGTVFSSGANLNGQRVKQLLGYVRTVEFPPDAYGTYIKINEYDDRLFYLTTDGEWCGQGPFAVNYLTPAQVADKGFKVIWQSA